MNRRGNESVIKRVRDWKVMGDRKRGKPQIRFRLASSNRRLKNNNGSEGVDEEV